MAKTLAFLLRARLLLCASVRLCEGICLGAAAAALELGAPLWKAVSCLRRSNGRGCGAVQSTDRGGGVQGLLRQVGRDYQGSHHGKRLFQMINNLPTIYEVVTGAVKKQMKEKTPNGSSKSNKSSSKKQARQLEPQTKALKMPPPKQDDESGREDEDEKFEEHGNTLCGACGVNYANDEF